MKDSLNGKNTIFLMHHFVMQSDKLYHNIVVMAITMKPIITRQYNFAKILKLAYLN
jgi:hypothetical protein